MARGMDYKHVGRSGEKPPVKDKRAGPFLLGFASGAAVLAAAVMAFGYFSQPQPQPGPPATACEPNPASAQPAGHPVVDSYSYDFFDILREGIGVPEPEVEGDEEVRYTYLLQAGSFHTRSKAEVFQEEIKAFGFDSEVVVNEGDDNVWYVVTIGPDENLSRINNAKLKLRARGIEPLIIKR